jgi:hypothetical protein
MSTIKANTLLHSDGSTTTQPSIPALDQRMAKAWVVFNGTGTLAVIGSYGVSSVTDNAVGRYTVNFSTAFANTNYCATANARYVNPSWPFALVGMSSDDAKTTSAMKFGTALSSQYFLDSPEVGLAFLGS